MKREAIELKFNDNDNETTRRAVSGALSFIMPSLSYNGLSCEKTEEISSGKSSEMISGIRLVFIEGANPSYDLCASMLRSLFPRVINDSVFINDSSVTHEMPMQKAIEVLTVAHSKAKQYLDQMSAYQIDCIAPGVSAETLLKLMSFLSTRIDEMKKRIADEEARSKRITDKKTEILCLAEKARAPIEEWHKKTEERYKKALADLDEKVAKLLKDLDANGDVEVDEAALATPSLDDVL